MDKQQQTVEQIFAAALERSPEDREAFLDRACAQAPEIRQHVEALLLGHDRVGRFLKEPLAPPASAEGRTNGTEAVTIDDFSVSQRKGPANGAHSARFHTGQIIAERFTIVRVIAHGGMGEVYEVEDRILERVHIALKVIRPEIAADATSSQRFAQEVLLARKVTHPNLCPIYDISLCEEPAPPFLFLTMKLLQGITLADRLRSIKPVTRDEAVSSSTR